MWGEARRALCFIRRPGCVRSDDDRSRVGLSNPGSPRGARPDPTTGARAVPIFQTSSYVFEDVTDAADLFALQKYGMIYSRLGNPTVSAFEERMASLDGALGAVAASSGHAAEFLAIATLAEAGDHIVSSSHLYGGTITMFSNTLGRFGIETTFVDPTDVDGSPLPSDRTRRCCSPRRSATCPARSPTSRHLPMWPTRTAFSGDRFDLLDAGAVPPDGVGRRHRRALRHQVHRWSWHLPRRGGDRGRHVRLGSGRFANMTEPVPTYNDLRWWDNFGEYSYLTKLRNDHLRDLGSTLAPMHAFLFLQGLETLDYRMAGHVANARAVAAWLEADAAWRGSTTQGCPHRRITTWRPNTSRTGQAPCSPSAWPVAELRAPPSSSRWR